MIRFLGISAVLLAALLTLSEAMDLHCRLTCKEDGEDSGRWNVKEKKCECIYIRYPRIKLNTVWPPEQKEYQD